MSEYTIRALTVDDHEAQLALTQTAFLSVRPDDDSRVHMELELVGARRLGAFADGRLVGVASAAERGVTLPHGVAARCMAVTWVAVAPDFRRRGVLTGLLRTQLQEAHADGPAVAALWASEASIYQRFGYGLASTTTSYEVPAKAPFRAEIDLGDARVRESSGEEAAAVARPIYDAYAATRAGALERRDQHWRSLLNDPASFRGGKTRLRWALHPEGYLIFRTRPRYDDRGPNCVVEIEELITTTPRAHAALLRYALDMDLAGEINYWTGMDDPLPALLANGRSAIAKVSDALYIRLVDVERALAQRRYQAPVDVVIEVADALCPWNEGRVRLTVGDNGVPTVTRTGDPADLATRSTELGAAYLGGTRLTRLADAGLVRESTPGAVSALTAALLSDREPRTLEVF